MTDTSVADTAQTTTAATTAAATTADTAAAATPAYYETFADPGAKDYAAKAGWKSPEDVVKHAQKFDAFKDADPAALTTVPKADDPNAFVAFAREKLGAPSDPATYGLDKIEGVDPAFAGTAAAWFTEAGLTQFQARHVADKFVEMQKAQTIADVAEEKASGEREVSQLKTEWQGEFDTKIELGRRALRAAASKAGVDPAEVLNYIESGAGAGAALKMAAFFGGLMGESDFVDGEANAPQAKPLQERLYRDI